MSERLGQPFVVENRPGAATNIAIDAVVRSAPDGYTIAAVTSTNAINATLYNNLNFDFARDITPIGSITSVPNVMAVHPSLPASTVQEFIAYAKANPGKVNFASSGPVRGAPRTLPASCSNAGRRQHPAHPLSWRGTCADRPARWQVQVALSSMPSLIEYVRAENCARSR